MTAPAPRPPSGGEPFARASDVEVESARGFVRSIGAGPLVADDELAATLRRVVAWLRPSSGRGDEAAARVDALCRALDAEPEVTRALGTALHGWLVRARCYRAFVGLGLFSRRGFVREVVDRTYERLNPAPRDPTDLRDQLALLFDEARDGMWVSAVPAAQWAALYATLSAPLDDTTRARTALHLSDEALHALEMLATWVAAEEIDEDLLRLDPVLADVDSAFIALNREVGAFVGVARTHVAEPPRRPTPDDTTAAAPIETDGSPVAPALDVAHAQVMVRQCEAQVARLRKRAVTRGTSLATTHLLERLAQTIRRIDGFLVMVAARDGAARADAAAELFRRFVVAVDEQRRLRPLWRRSVRRLALSITDKEGERGEHYITRDRAGWRAMWRSAAGAGVIVALLALGKLQLKSLGLATLPEALLASLNYGLGFVLVHVLHCTIATKQPAMTASRLAEDVQLGQAGRVDPDRLAATLVDLIRSQLAAVAGNVAVAVLVATLVAWLVRGVTGAPLLDADAVAYQLHRVAPAGSGALCYAAIAGVWLFLSGIIAGGVDNRAAYLDLRARLADHPLLVRLVPASARRARIADYWHAHYGAIAGNFLFGVMLGMTPWLGTVLGLPLDIRHVAFSSADVGYAAASGAIGVRAVLGALGAVLLIGAVNLAVSFSLAFWVALRARETRLGSVPGLLSRFVATVRAAPRLLVLPPGDE